MVHQEKVAEADPVAVLRGSASAWPTGHKNPYKELSK